MRLFLALAAGSVVIGEAAAQSKPWHGGYVGVSGSLGGLATETTVSVDVERAGRSDADYSNTLYEVSEGEANSTRKVGSDSAPGLVLFGGLTVDEESFVWGGEARLEIRSVQRDLVSGTISWAPSGLSGRQAAFPIPSGVPSGISTRTGIVQERESVNVTMKIGDSASVLGRFGIPVGDAVLVSALAGISAAKVQMIVTQTSEQFGAYYYNLPIPNSPQLSVPINSSSIDRASSEKTKVGPAVGALAEIQLNQMLALRADVQYTYLGETKIKNNAGTAVSFQPDSWSTSIGMAYRF